MTRLYRSISFFTAPALLALFGCGGEKTTGPVPTARINPSLASAGLAAVASRFYEQHNLVSDGAVPADLVDPALVNAWGLVASASSPWWIADNGSDVSTLYNGNTGAKLALTVSVPSAPTGVVFNGGTGFAVSRGTAAAPARFGIRNLGGTIYVTYALQDADKHDDVAGVGHGFVNAFDPGGHLLRRVASRGRLNSPWGLALAPADFGQFGGDLLVGNFGDGHINAFDPEHFEGNGELQERGQLHAADGPPTAIDGLWALAFGNGASAGPTNALFFTAGPFGEEHGLFGKLVVSSPPAGNRP